MKFVTFCFFGLGRKRKCKRMRVSQAEICCNLTLPDELILTASVEEVLKKVGGKKAEFMLVIM